MFTPTTIKKDDYHCGTIRPVVTGNFLSIQAQIHLKNQCKRHDKTRSRSKQKRAWKKDY